MPRHSRSSSQSTPSSFDLWANGLVRFSKSWGRLSWLAFLMIFTFTCVVSLPGLLAAPANFSDLGNSWMKPCVERLATQDIIRGFPDGTFRPKGTVTRAEFASMVVKAFPQQPVIRQGGNFADVPGNHWAKTAIAQAYRQGFVSGYANNQFNPNQPIPRTQAVVSLASGLKLTPTAPVEQVLTAFEDGASIPGYGRNAIAAATEKQLVVNYPNIRRFNPNQSATRGEIAAFLCQATQNTGLIPAQYVAQVPNSQPISRSELRGVWLTNIDSQVLFNRNTLAQAIDRLQQLNFNTLYPTVWNGGYTLYPSAVAQQTIGKSLDPTPGLQGRDMLQEIVDQGHAKKMAVIPWFEFGFMAPADSELAKRHPDWLLKRRDGTTVWMEGTIPRVWLNPYHPQVQKFITDLVVELVRNYDIDGIQFDDHFGFPVEFGYDDLTRQLYQQSQGSQPPTDVNNAQWVRWRADRITDSLKQLFTAIKAVKPNVIVSLSPNPQEYSYKSFLADWQTWERQGLIEELIIQIYRDDLSRFVAELERPEVIAAKQHIPVGIGILSGIKPRPIALGQIQQQVKAVRDRNFAGMSFFFFESLWNMGKETPSQRQTALQALYALPAERPDLLRGWKPK